ncbi:MAG: amidohydrolase family protein [Desulfobacterales bacterium]|nr:amidohydrolase family protein [Desulfobacterales bacterium]
MKNEFILDFCVIPPLPETIEGFANPQGPFAKYNEMYKADADAVEILKSDPLGILLHLMDQAGVDRAVLPAEDAETTMGMVTPNEKVAAFAAQSPDRFIPMAAVDPHKGMQALADLEYAAGELGMKALCLEPWLHQIPANHKLYYPIYAKAVELDLPIWIHTSLNFVPSLKMEYGRPIHLDEVAGHFPELKLIAGHGGWPWVNELMAVLWRHDNVYLDISAIHPKHMAKAGSGWEPLLNYGNGLLQDRVLFGTAWPACQFKDHVEGVAALPLKEEVKKKWLGLNAKRLLKL